tara:strand:- start:4283 stop:9571 length:5289 start_codon:yes stop_codon:yes gene_type:complete
MKKFNKIISYWGGDSASKRKNSKIIFTLLFGFIFSSGFAQSPPLDDHKCQTSDDNTNWKMSRTYSYNGQVLGAEIEFSDYRGRSLQSQSWSAVHDEVFATQPLYDTYGRMAIQTLGAPINTDKFCYQSTFITQSNGTAYSTANFEDTKLNNPDVIGNSIQGTLGWWYSDNNTDEPYQATSSFPYIRTEYSSRTGRARRVAAPGDELRMGLGRENESYLMPAAGELYYVFGFGHGWNMNSANQSVSTPSYQVVKSISVDPEGNEMVSFTDRDGKLIATALSGSVNGVNKRTLHVTSVIDEKGYVDIHLPNGCQSSLRLYNPHNNIKYQIIDLKTDEILNFGENPYFTGTAPNLPAGFYRIRDLKEVVDNLASGNLVSLLPGTIHAFSMQINLPVNYDLNYYEFALNYFDKAGRVVKTIPPLGIATGYSPSPIVQQDNTATFSLYNYNGDLSFSSTSAIKNDRITITGQSSTSEYKEIIVEFRHKTVANSTLITQAEILNAALTGNTEDITKAGDDLYYVQAMHEHLEISSTNTHLRSELGESFSFTNSKNKDYPPRLPVGVSMTCPHMAEVYEIHYDVFSGGQYTSNPNNPDIASNRRIWIMKKYNEECELETIELNGDKFIISNAQITAGISEVQLVIKSLKKIVVNNVGGEKYVNLQASDYNFVDDYNLFLSEKTHVYGAPAHNMESTFVYNSLGWLIESTSPEEGKTEFTYRKDGQLRFSQNSKQRVENKFAYANYDHFGRVTEIGVYTKPIQGGYTFQNYTTTSNSDGSNSLLENNFSYTNYLEDGLDDNHCTEQVFTLYDKGDVGFSSAIGSSLSPHYKQTFVRGKVSKTWDHNSTIWYGYDELGRQTWQIQSISGLGGVKTMDYSYNGFGVLEKIEYQKYNPDERLDHIYTYDVEGKLKQVYTSLDGEFKTKQAEYFYYKGGGLKRTEIADKLQGEDFVYTLNGTLKSVNSPSLDRSQDPGEDGLVSANNELFQPDIFGMSLDYYQNDYKRSGTFINAEAGSQGSFLGNITQVRWNKRKNPNDNFTQQQMFQYEYDHQNRLTQAEYGLYTAGNCINLPVGQSCSNPVNPAFVANSSNNYKVWNITYDANSNLLSLNRNGYGNASETPMDQFTYNYGITNGKRTDNKLLSVADAGDNSNASRYLDIRDQGSSNFTYNSLGQMTSNEQEDSHISYNERGLVSMVYGNFGLSNQYKKVEYIYNALGQRTQKIDYNNVSGASNTALRKTWYVRAAGGTVLAVYEQDLSNGGIVELTEQSIYGSNRLGNYKRPSAPHAHIGYAYEFTDHLGNVRSTYANEPSVDYYSDFRGGNLDSWDLRPNTLGAIFDPDGVTITTHTTGGVKEVFDNIPTGGTYTIEANVKSIVLGQPNGLVGVKLTVVDITTGSIILGSQTTETPGSLSITFKNVATTKIAVHVFVPNSLKGSGNSFTLRDVSITQNELTVLSERDYYPFGMEMPGKSYTAAGGNYRYAFQGQERDNEAGASHEFFTLRTWDGRLGRWTSPDPYAQFFSPYNGMGNNPINGVDPDGGLFIVDDWIIGGVKGLFSGEGFFQSANRHAINSAKIWGGLFTSDKNKSSFGQYWQIFSRFSWELPQTLGGFFGAHATNTFGTINSVNYLAGATVMNVGSKGWGGLTIGSYIFGDYRIQASKTNYLFLHEYGHYIQSQYLGVTYLPVIALPSLFSAAFGSDHHSFYTETWAESLSGEYFYPKIPLSSLPSLRVPTSVSSPTILQPRSLIPLIAPGTNILEPRIILGNKAPKLKG